MGSSNNRITSHDNTMFGVALKVIEFMGGQTSADGSLQSQQTLEVATPILSKSLLVDNLKTTLKLLKTTSGLIDDYATPPNWPGYWSNQRSNLECLYKSMGLLMGLSLTFKSITPSQLSDDEKSHIWVLCQDTIEQAHKLRSLMITHDLQFDASECSQNVQRLNAVLRSLCPAKIQTV